MNRTMIKKLADMLISRESIERIRFIRRYKISKSLNMAHTDELYFPESNDDGVIASSEPNGFVPF